MGNDGRPMSEAGGSAADCPSWDVFCRVVDNFGDAGVAWRLARLLAREHGKRVRLWLDEPATLARLRPEVDARAASQLLEGVEIRRWAPGSPDPKRDGVADVVVETFGCDVPESYVSAMAARSPHPRWINLEYLSAEEWVEGCHALPSPHPRHAPLTRHFFFPGFTPRTGGLLRESGLLARREIVQSDGLRQAHFWQSVAGREPSASALRVSLFGYAGAPYAGLFGALAASPTPVWLVVPEGTAAVAARAWSGDRGASGTGSLTVVPIPFLDQDRYDELLWACDVNFVRGEDSFVRAQWAGRPFVWQPYPTADGAHRVKLAAFLARYTAGMGRGPATAATGLWEAWNRGEGLDAAWRTFEAELPALRLETVAWCRLLSARPDLAAQLVDFADHVIA